MRDFRVDGMRMDSVENVANWDFVGEFKDLARRRWKRPLAARGSGGGATTRFLVVGRGAVAAARLLAQGRLDGLWNERFSARARGPAGGQRDAPSRSFEWTVRKVIDCRLFGFTDGAQAVNYLTSHDVEGFRNERLFNFLNSWGRRAPRSGSSWRFACLLTAVGVPMILAGEEFADQHDRVRRRTAT